MSADTGIVIYPLEHLGGGLVRTAYNPTDPHRGGYEVAFVERHFTREQRNQFGNEFAASHDMVEALEALVAIAPENADDADDPEQRDAWRKANAALTKAKGGAR